MTKTFKSVNADAKKDLLVVLGVDEGVNIHTESPVDRRGVSIAPSDAPALALAILEAAGYRNYVGSGDELGLAVDNLDKHIAWVETQTAEAKERAELEAEALELFKTFMGVKGYENFTWSEVVSKDEWLAVARKARELRAEK